MALPETASTQAGDQKTVTPDVAKEAVDGAEQQQQQRPAKRTRREKGSATKSERVSKMPPCTAGKRSSIYRGVTRHRWTGRYEAHLWDKTTWNQTQQKKGKQVYLGAYDEEEAAARAYDLAALKYWGPGTLINFPLVDYARDIEEMQNVTREEYLASLRRKSSGFSRGVSKYRGVARHHHNGRWEARIGRVFGNKYLYLGTYSTQEEAAAAYDMAAIEYRGLNAVTNFDLSRYIRWLRPGQSSSLLPENDASLSPNTPTAIDESSQLTGLTEDHQQHGPGQQEDQQQLHSMWGAVKSTSDAYQSIPSLAGAESNAQQLASSSPTALSLLVQSSMFKQMLERASATAPTDCEIESSISSSYPASSENSFGIDHQQQQHHSQQQLQDADGWNQQQHQDTTLWSQQQHQDTNEWSQQQHQDTNIAWNQLQEHQECMTACYSSSAWEKPITHQQTHNVQIPPLEMGDLQDPSVENEGSVVHPGHDDNHAYQQRLRQQFITKQVQNVVDHGHLFSDFQDQLLQQSFQNYSSDLSHHRHQQQQQDPLTAAYGSHSLSSVVSSLYSDQDSGGSTIDDSSWAFPNLLSFSNGTIAV